ncbi:MAG: Gfo/Idh/MocA family oxidoreductase [Syntrophales bacterium]|jgi:UDP-2-acetamido-3-amino-2,3-dideoxy-glucuronate N-acetyltransferase|nr:Gfo/Idh/MocA family oxidoreductase [Syntrophales bacterium]
MKICVVGAGRWGTNHIRTLNELEMLGGVVESSAERRALLKHDFPGLELFADYRKAADAAFDGYTVATPADTHCAIAACLMGKGRHVLVEKPMALTVEDARAMKRLADERGVILMVGHVLLFHPAIRKMKELVDDGTIGRLQYMYSNRLNLGAVRMEENILWSFAPHDISIFQYFMGDYPREIISRGGVFLQPSVHDSSMTILSYPGNRVGHVFVSWLHPFKEHRIVIIGSKGMLSYEDSSPERQILFYEKGIDWVQGEPVSRDGATDLISHDASLPLTEELAYFAQCIAEGRKPDIATAESGIEVLRILEEATECLVAGSVPSSRPVVESRRLAGGGRDYFVHESAVIDDRVSIGSGTKIWHFSHILSGSSLGDDCSLGQNVVVGPDVTIGARCKIQNNVSVYKGVTLEEGVFCGPSMVFTNVFNPRAEIRRMEELRPTLVKRGATIGANATVVCGNTIGRWAFIGAGSVVVEDVPDHALVVGNPAKQAGWVCECGEKLPKKLSCKACRKLYEKTGKGLRKISTMPLFDE